MSALSATPGTLAADATAPLSASPVDRWFRFRQILEIVLVPAVALTLAAIAFSIFLLLLGKSPVDFVSLLWRGAFGSWFSLQNTLLRAAPLLLAALCVALPAQLGLVIIGGEGAIVLGGLAAAAIALPLAALPPLAVQIAMAIAGMAAGGAWIGLSGWLRARRGLNETIVSLLLSYIAIAIFNHLVEGPLRDPASLNKPSTPPIGASNMLPSLFGTDLHVGLIFGLIACVAFGVLIDRTSFGFACRVTGGNIRAAQTQGLPVARLIIVACALGGACAGLAGATEVGAVLGSANASLIAGYGYTGILVAFLAGQNAFAIIPMAVLVGGISASGGLLQRRLGLPDATVLVLNGTIFVSVLACETLRGRFAWFGPRGAA